MKPRSTWSGILKLSLVAIPVRVYTVISTGEKISFNQLHKGCHHRVGQKLVCPVHGEVPRDELVKGYEYAPDKFIVVEPADLDRVRLETTDAIELFQFVQPAELDPLLCDTPYYLGPDGPVAEEGFCVLREAIRKTNLIGIGRVVLSGREKLIALKPLGNGFAFFTLRYGAELRPPSMVFDDLQPRPLEEKQLTLAQQLIESYSGPLNLAGLADRYQTALLDLIKAKVDGTEPVLVPRSGVGPVLGLMDALQQSVAQSRRNTQPMPKASQPSKNGSRRKLESRLGESRTSRSRSISPVSKQAPPAQDRPAPRQEVGWNLPDPPPAVRRPGPPRREGDGQITLTRLGKQATP